MSIDEARKNLVGKTASFNESIILKDISKVKGLSELLVDCKQKTMLEELKRGVTYGVMGTLVQPHKEVEGDSKKDVKTVFVYFNTEIVIITDEENLSKQIADTKDAFNLIQQEGYY